jgi:hypothetical protein
VQCACAVQILALLQVARSPCFSGGSEGGPISPTRNQCLRNQPVTGGFSDHSGEVVAVRFPSDHLLRRSPTGEPARAR